VTFAYPPIVGGLPQQAHLLSKALKDQGMNVTVVTIRINGYPKVERLDGVPVYRLWTLLGQPTATRYRSRIYPWLLPLIFFLFSHRQEYDIIHVHQAMHPAAVCVLIGKLLGKPTVVRITGSGATGNISMLSNWRWLGIPVRKIIRHANCFVSLSEDITSELLADGFPSSKIIHIPNAVDATFFSPPKLNEISSRKKIVLGVGRLSEEKGFDILVKAWEKIFFQEPNTCLQIVGDGLERQTLEALAERLGIGNAISFEGNRDNVSDYLAGADIFVLPSRSEGMSNALLEAMAMGKACIASNIPANSAILAHEVNGLLFKKNDPQDLAAQIFRLLQERHLGTKLGKNARDKIIAQFSIDKIADLYIRLYSQLASSGELKA
jgi:glycosyltransferase involved in cell wall biosynthesis